ncbi:hypothetical protein [Cyclobacterium plantarum]|uniref:hypothetical protein n=1 Tax=Cyclobacterium plantarum TaxID=2716263 RepID=UPI003F724766
MLVKQMLDIELIKIYPKQFLAGTLPGVKEQALPEIMTKIELKVHKSEKGTIAHPTRAIVGN